MNNLSTATPIATIEKTRQLLRELHFSPHKSLGQNFLVSSSIAAQIVQAARVEEIPRVLEIGPGLGALSQALAQQAQALALLELDQQLCSHLRQLLPGQKGLEIIHGDALAFDYQDYASGQGWPDYQVVANLPYYITSPLLRRLLLQGGPWQRLTLMMQREVAEKLLSPSRRNMVGPLALLLEYLGETRLLIMVPPKSFWPAPEVQSAVIQIERRKNPPFPLADIACFEGFLQAAFSLRRKTLANSLSAAFHIEREFWQIALDKCQLAVNCRAEELSLQDYGRLFSLPQLQSLLGK